VGARLDNDYLQTVQDGEITEVIRSKGFRTYIAIERGYPRPKDQYVDLY